MRDMRLITIDDDNFIELTGKKINEPLKEREASIQYLVLTMMNTPGTMVDSPNFGGGAFILNTKMRKQFSQTREEVAEVIHDTNMSIRSTNPDFGAFTIDNVILQEVERASRGYNVKIKVNFTEALSEQFTVSGNENVNI